MIPRITNNYFISTPHRVINNSSISRYSIPFFYEPCLDSVIKCLPKYLNPDGTANYTNITFQQHLNNMFQHTYKRHKQT